jgi:hypothetical protein
MVRHDDGVHGPRVVTSSGIRLAVSKPTGERSELLRPAGSGGVWLRWDQAASTARMRSASSRTASDGPLDETAGGLGGDAELLADLAVALALAAVDEAEALLDGVAGPRVEHVEQFGDELVLGRPAS